MPSIPTRAINKLINGKIEIRLMNGCYNEAQVKVTNAGCRYELTVSVTHPELRWMSPTPDELVPLVAKMKVLATMTDSYARTLSQENAEIFNESLSQMGFSC